MLVENHRRKKTPATALATPRWIMCCMIAGRDRSVNDARGFFATAA